MRKGPDRPQKGADSLRSEEYSRKRRIHDPNPQRTGVYPQQKRLTQRPQACKYIPS